VSYVICGAAMAIGIAAALRATEPAQADSVMEAKAQAARRNPFAAVIDAVFGPLFAFFRDHGVAMAALMLGMITLYHLSDYGRGPMIAPYYTALGIDKDTIAAVRLVLGTPATFFGIALGGISSVRLGAMRSLVIGAVVQVIAVGNFAILGFHGGDFDLLAAEPVHVTAFQAIMTFDSLAMGYAGIALVSYMSTLTSLGYTATQYALLTSALAITGKTLKAWSGTIVKSIQHGGDLLHALTTYYLVCAAFGVPAIAMCLILAAVVRPRLSSLVPQRTGEVADRTAG
jgi:PAT family beta-lactamase induction signal transducer AmpG